MKNRILAGIEKKVDSLHPRLEDIPREEIDRLVELIKKKKAEISHLF